MKTQLTPSRLAEPPPLDLDLVDNDRRVGWMTHDVIGFCGFANDFEAVYAAWVADRTMARRIARRNGNRPVLDDPASLYLRRDTDTVHTGERTIAALVRPGLASPSGPDTFGFELRVATAVDEVEIRASALAIYRSLRRSGIQWSVWQSDSQLSARDASAAFDVTPTADENATTPGIPRFMTGARALRPLITPAAVLVLVSLLLLVVGLATPQPFAVILAFAGLTGLFAMRIFALHAGWPARSPHRVCNGHPMENATCRK